MVANDKTAGPAGRGKKRPGREGLKTDGVQEFDP